MSQMLRYYVIRTYKGVFRKKHVGNTHLLIAPINSNEFMMLIILGEVVGDREDKYASVLSLRRPLAYLTPIIDSMKQSIGDRMTEVESVACTPKMIKKGDYVLRLPKKGVFLKSDLKITYEPEFSDAVKKIYLIDGVIDLVTSGVSSKTIGMVANKAMAKMSVIRAKRDY